MKKYNKNELVKYFKFIKEYDWKGYVKAIAMKRLKKLFRKYGP